MKELLILLTLWLGFSLVIMIIHHYVPMWRERMLERRRPLYLSPDDWRTLNAALMGHNASPAASEHSRNLARRVRSTYDIED